MITITVLLSVLVLAILWTLFVPVNIEIDSSHQYYRIYLPGLLGVRASKYQNKWMVKGNVFFFRFNLLKSSKRQNNTTQIKKTHKQGKKKTISHPVLFFQHGLKSLSGILKSFKVKKLKAEIDTGDVILNTQLYPAVALMGGNYSNIDINFENRNSIEFIAKGQLFHVVRHGLQFYIKNNKLIIKK